MPEPRSDPVVVGKVAPWVLLAAAAASTWFLAYELRKTDLDPAPPRYDRGGDADDALARDAATLPGAERIEAETRATTPTWLLPSAPSNELVVVVRTPDGGPAPWRHVGVRRRGEIGGRAAYTDEFGEARVPLSQEQADDRAEGRLEAFLRDPGRPDVAAAVGTDATRVAVAAPLSATARVVLLDPSGARPERTPIVVSIEDGTKRPATAYVAVGTTALIAGLPFDVPVRFSARPYGRAAAERTAWFFPDLGDVQTVSLPLEKPTATLEGELPSGYERGEPVRVAAWSYDRAAEPFVAFSTADDRGRFAVAAPPGVSLIVDVRTRKGTPRLWSVSRLEPGVATATPPIDAPPRVLRGRVLKPDSRPAVGALVVGAMSGEEAQDDARPAPAATTDEEGRFELVAPVGVAACRPQARYADEDDFATYAAEGPKAAFGSPTPIELSLGQGGVVAGFLEGTPRERLGGPFGATIALEDAHGTPVGFGVPALDGSFAAPSPAGEVRVRVRVPGLPPIVIDDVVVPKGASTVDRRLRPVKLPGPFVVARVRVERADAPPDSDPLLRGALVVARFEDEETTGREPIRAYTESLGDVRLPYVRGTRPRFDVSWRDPSREDFALRSVSLKPDEGETTLVARLPLGAIVTFEGATPAPEPPQDAIASVVLAREDPSDPLDGTPRVLSLRWRRGTPTFGSVPDGEWRARLEVLREGDKRGATVVDLGVVSVKPTDARVVAPLDPAAAARAFFGG